MKKTIIAFIFLSVLMSCSSVDNTPEKDIALVEKYIQAVENMDFETMESLLDQNYIGVGPSYGDTIRREQAIENWKYNVENLYEKIEYSKSRNVAVTITNGDNMGEWVVNWAELNIIYKNNGGSITIWANTNYQFVNGKITKSFTLYNEADALRQLGYIFVKPDEL